MPTYMGMNPTFFKTVGTSAALLLFFGAGCGVAKAPTSMVPGVSDTNTNVNVKSEQKGEIVWRTTKNDFSVRVPEDWRVSQADAGGISLVQLTSLGKTDPDATILIFSGSGTDSFDAWVQAGGSNGNPLKDSIMIGKVNIDGVDFELRKEDGRTLSAYGALVDDFMYPTFLRFSYELTNQNNTIIDDIFKSLQFNLTSEEALKARVIP